MHYDIEVAASLACMPGMIRFQDKRYCIICVHQLSEFYSDVCLEIIFDAVMFSGHDLSFFITHLFMN